MYVHTSTVCVHVRIYIPIIICMWSVCMHMYWTCKLIAQELHTYVLLCACMYVCGCVCVKAYAVHKWTTCTAQLCRLALLYLKFTSSWKCTRLLHEAAQTHIHAHITGLLMCQVWVIIGLTNWVSDLKHGPHRKWHPPMYIPSTVLSSRRILWVDTKQLGKLEAT